MTRPQAVEAPTGLTRCVSQYINFDQDDVVVGAGARVNRIYKDVIPSWLRPHRSLAAKHMLGVWVLTPDVEKIQRVVACGNFV